MTMTGSIGGVPWYRCAEATRLFDAYVTACRDDDEHTDAPFVERLPRLNAIAAAWDEYQTHVRECEDCKKARRGE